MPNLASQKLGNAGLAAVTIEDQELARACFVRTLCFQAAGIESGDILYKLDGVRLGSYKEGLALFRNKTGPVVITCFRQDDVTV